MIDHTCKYEEMIPAIDGKVDKLVIDVALINQAIVGNGVPGLASRLATQGKYIVWLTLAFAALLGDKAWAYLSTLN